MAKPLLEIFGDFHFFLYFSKVLDKETMQLWAEGLTYIFCVLVCDFDNRVAQERPKPAEDSAGESEAFGRVFF